MKICARCGYDLPNDRFTADPRMRSGLKSYCRDCCRLYARERYPKVRARVLSLARANRKKHYTTEKGRARHIQAYGLTKDAYRALLLSQGMRCAICGTDAPGGKGDWHIDHDHFTGLIRGLLCANCNVAIGMMADDPNRLYAAARYIESRRGAIS